MSLDLDISLDTLIAWKRKPFAMVEDLFGARTPRVVELLAYGSASIRQCVLSTRSGRSSLRI
jgi:hypothetical protein